MNKTNKLWSRQLFYTPLGGQTLSKLPSRYVNGVYPKLLVKGQGGVVTDVDGREYIDYIAGLGAVSVGYNNQTVNNAIKEQLEKGISFSLPNPLEADVAEALSKLMPEMDMWKFGKNGTDATLMAIRCARALTGRKKILVHGYHGCSDHFEALGTRKAGMIDLADFVKRFDGKYDYSDHSFAAIIVEPRIFAPLDWQAARDWCNETNTLLIFDEIVTGGRFPGFTAYKHMGIVPDMVTVGKGLANGMPFSAVGGKQEIMRTFERDDIFASMTFGGECLSLAACLATLPLIKESISRSIEYGSGIQRCFDLVFEGLARCEGFPTRTQFVFPSPEHKALFWQECVKEGVLFGYSNFIMTDHSTDDLVRTLSVIVSASRVVKNNWHDPLSKLEGSLPVEALRLINR